MLLAITFPLGTVKPHITLSNMRDFVIKDIAERYQANPIKEVHEPVITLDPGGMARFGENIKYIEATYNEVTFRCQNIHLLDVLFLLDKVKAVDTPFGKVARIYFQNCVLMLPLDWWSGIRALFLFEEENGINAVNELRKTLAGVVQFKGK